MFLWMKVLIIMLSLMQVAQRFSFEYASSEPKWSFKRDLKEDARLQ